MCGDGDDDGGDQTQLHEGRMRWRTQLVRSCASPCVRLQCAVREIDLQRPDSSVCFFFFFFFTPLFFRLLWHLPPPQLPLLPLFFFFYYYYYYVLLSCQPLSLLLPSAASLPPLSSSTLFFSYTRQSLFRKFFLYITGARVCVCVYFIYQSGGQSFDRPEKKGMRTEGGRAIDAAAAVAGGGPSGK